MRTVFLLLLAVALGACSTTTPIAVLVPAPEPKAETVPELAKQTSTRVARPPGSVIDEKKEKEVSRNNAPARQTTSQLSSQVTALCAEIGRKLGSVSRDDCLRQHMQYEAVSVLNRPLAYKDYAAPEPDAQQWRVLLVGGIHGDEFSSVSVVFKWMDMLDQTAPWPLSLRVVPLANPDGLLRAKSQRQNENGVDLNRNFPSMDWATNALDYWVETTSKNIRRYPGETSASEPETRWLVAQIRDFAPDVIIALHAPHHLVDYDGPPSAPQQVGKLNLRQLGVYPGSLGNYAGHDLKTPVVTLELQSAGIMPSTTEIEAMLDDLQRWLLVQLSQQAVNPDPPSVPSSATSR
jgi:protein MpaA